MTSQPAAEKPAPKRHSAAQTEPGKSAAAATGAAIAGEVEPAAEPKSRPRRAISWGLYALLVSVAAGGAVYYLLDMRFERRAQAFNAQLAALERDLGRAQDAAAQNTGFEAHLAGLDERLSALESRADPAAELAGLIAAHETRLTALAAESASLMQQADRARAAAAELQRRIAALEAERRPSAAFRYELAAAWLGGAKIALAVHNDGRRAVLALDALSDLFATDGAGDAPQWRAAATELRQRISETGAARERLRAELQHHAATTVAWDPAAAPKAAPAPEANRWQRFKTALARLFVLRRVTPRDEVIANLSFWRLETERRWHDLAQAIDFGDPDRVRRQAAALAERLAAADTGSDLSAARNWLEALAAAGLPEWPSLDALHTALAPLAPADPDS